jgi:hypothetical protein
MLMSREHKDAGKLTRQLFRWVREISAEVACPLFLGAMARIVTTSQDKGRQTYEVSRFEAFDSICLMM